MRQAYRLWAALLGGRAGGGGKGALPFLRAAGASSSDELEDEESESESELDDESELDELDESEDELSEEDESSAMHSRAFERAFERVHLSCNACKCAVTYRLVHRTATQQHPWGCMTLG